MGSGGKGAQEGGDICTHVPDSHLCTAETNTTPWSSYTPHPPPKKIASEEKSQGVNKPANSGEWGCLWPPISATNWDYFPFSLKKCTWLSRLFGSRFWATLSSPSPQMAGILINSNFPFYPHVCLSSLSLVSIFEWWTVGPDSVTVCFCTDKCICLTCLLLFSSYRRSFMRAETTSIYQQLYLQHLSWSHGIKRHCLDISIFQMNGCNIIK